MALSKQLRAVPELGERGAQAVMASIGREAEIQAGIVRIVRSIGTHFHPADLAQVISDLRRFDSQLVAHALEDLMAAGKVRVLSREAFDEVYAKYPQWKKGLIDHGYLRPTVEGLYDRKFEVLFLKPSTFESLGGVAVHEVTHHLQKVNRPLMGKFHDEFEAFAAQRHYLQRLAASGVDPDMAFPSHKWLMDASNEDIVRHIAQGYGVAAPAGFDMERAVFDAILSVNREHSLVEVGEAVERAEGREGRRLRERSADGVAGDDVALQLDAEARRRGQLDAAVDDGRLGRHESVAQRRRPQLGDERLDQRHLR